MQKLSLLADEFYSLVEETKSAYDKTNSPLKHSYTTLIDELTHRLLERHSTDDRFFMSERVLSDLTEICQGRVTQKIMQPGYIWDSQITHNVCEMLTHVPAEDLQTDKNFLRAVSRLPPIHPIRAGPGTWFCMHVLAKGVKTYEDHMRVCDQFQDLMRHFYCPKCKQHFREYLQKNDPRKLLPERTSNVFKAIVVKETVSRKQSEPILVPKLFIWTVDFHNRVNEIKDDYSGAKTKFQMDLLDAWNLYQDYRDEKFTPCLSCSV